jgi:signal transduction histidine kinase
VYKREVLARWQEGQLVLARRRGATEEVLPISWPTLENELLAIIADVLPEARLVPAEGDGALRLAALPVTLVPGRLPSVELSEATRWTLIGAWLVAVAGLGGTVALVVVAIQLAQRRATFVSAVTHELRTPLTALRLHGDLLADERVASDPLRRAARIAVIRGEAERLAHLIENVLDYARLERRRPPQPHPLGLAELLAPMLPRLAERLNASAMTLDTAGFPLLVVRCDPAAVERILVNLIDNAAKYAAAAADRRVEFTAARVGNRVALVVRDHGPGLAADARARLFVPFARSAEAAAGSAPGTGLGLALCRRLARAQGGDLRHLSMDLGCAMELRLPLG